MNLRTWVVAAMVGLFALANAGFSALIAEDYADNYGAPNPDWVTTANEGVGFQAWDMWLDAEGTGGNLLGSSHGGLIDSANNTAFGILGASGYYNAARLLANPLAAGGALTFDISSNWRDGNQGFVIMDSSYGELFGFNINNSGYGSTGWGWFEGNDHIQVLVDQVSATHFQVSLTRVNDSETWASANIEGVVEGFRFYVGDTGGGSERNFYFNNLEAIPEPTTFALFGIGVAGLLLLIRRRKV